MTSPLTPNVTVTPLPDRTLRQTPFVETNISDFAVFDGKITYACYPLSNGSTKKSTRRAQPSAKQLISAHTGESGASPKM